MVSITRTARALFAAALLATATTPLLAQDETPVPTAEQPPLLEMLALVPNTPEALSGTPFLGYVDYRAIEEAREGVPSFENWAAFSEASAQPGDEGRLWVQNSMRIQTGPPFFVQYLMQFATTQSLVGFDVFDIDRALVFGQPPAMGNILQGDFDVEAITDAFVARDYVTEQNNGVVLLSNAEGAPGTTINPQTRDVANPFGGPLGRREPVAVTDTFILNSPNDALLEAMVNAYVGYRPSLYTQPDLVAAGEALTMGGQGDLLQAMFLNPLDVAFASLDPSVLLDPQATPDLEALLSVNEAYGPLGIYNVAVIADLQDGNDQIALIALVYNNENSARATAEEVSARLALLPLNGDAQLRPMIGEVDGAVVAEPNVYFSPGTGKYVALASVRYPLPENALVEMSTGEPIPEGEEGERPTYLPSGLLFRMWVNSLYTRAFDVLNITE